MSPWRWRSLVKHTQAPRQRFQCCQLSKVLKQVLLSNPSKDWFWHSEFCLSFSSVILISLLALPCVGWSLWRRTSERWVLFKLLRWMSLASRKQPLNALMGLIFLICFFLFWIPNSSLTCSFTAGTFVSKWEFRAANHTYAPVINSPVLCCTSGSRVLGSDFATFM